MLAGVHQPRHSIKRLAVVNLAGPTPTETHGEAADRISNSLASRPSVYQRQKKRQLGRLWEREREELGGGGEEQEEGIGTMTGEGAERKKTDGKREFWRTCCWGSERKLQNETGQTQATRRGKKETRDIWGGEKTVRGATVIKQRWLSGGRARTEMNGSSRRERESDRDGGRRF